MHNTNSLQDEIHLHKHQLENLSFLQKMQYYWQHYKVHTIITVFLACLFGSFLHPLIHQKETVLSIAYINAFPNIEDEEFIDGFENHLQLNPKRQQVLLDSSYYIDENSSSPYAATYSQKFSDNAAAGKFDVVLSDSANFIYFGNQGFFQDLRTVLSEEELEKYQKHLYYIDYPNDKSKSKIPIGIKIDKANKICETCSYPNTDAYFGIISGTKHVDTALSYLNYLEN